ncbi:MAG: helix-turn-helix domain-containing protein [Eubacterium sp.]
MYYPRIKQLRQEQGKTQTVISELIGIDQSYYSKYERGAQDISLDVVIALADLYNVSVDYIIGRSDKKEINR